MAVNVQMTDSIELFKKLTPDLVPRIMELEKAGVVCQVKYFTVSMVRNGKVIAGCSLPSSVVSLLKGTAPGSAKQMAITGLIHTTQLAYEIVFPNSGEKQQYLVVKSLKFNGMNFNEGEVIPLSASEAMVLGEKVKPVPIDVPVETQLKLGALLKDHLKGLDDSALPAAKKKPLPGEKVPLAHATELLQKVRGTDASSTYYAVALSDRMKVGARVKNTALSLRLEGPMSEMDKKKAESVGFLQSSQGHLSVHIDCKNVPPHAVLGGMLFRLGVSFPHIVTNAEEMPVEH